MRDADNSYERVTHSRRRFLRSTGGVAAATAGMALAGCMGGDDEEGIRVPGIYDLSGGTADVGRPTGLGSRDAIAWYNENDELDEEIIHDWQDYAYEVDEAQQQYSGHTADDFPPVIIGWGTADTEALANDAHFDEVVYISASYSDALLGSETQYNFYTNLDYTSQARAHLQWIADNDPDATVAFIHNTTAFGESPIPGGEAYAEELGLDLEDNITLELDEGDAGTQVQRAENNGVDYLIHQNTADPMRVLLQAIDQRGADITVMGLTWTVDEFRVAEFPELFEGARYVNANVTWDEALALDARGAQIIEESFEREGRDMDDPEDANLNYVRGVTHAALAIEGIKLAQEMGNDPHSGADVREAFFELEGFDGEGLLPQPLNFEEDDRRATMTGQMFEVQNGELVHDGAVELERRDDWLPE
ncbi:ABC transporter substrate-binding protein [Natronobeatus ordinarius]|uniref:ABC transporter substrate-binding protein n=1 Tax=Natronobeatus ordinarius TaxID=2963433 RepID=UPI0020CF01D8|nr:ABC transporter substrate-binding protein [Natronobeatus ordinarius]